VFKIYAKSFTFMFVKYNTHCRLCIGVLLSVDRAVRGWANVVGIAALYGLDGLGSNPGRGKIFTALQTGPGTHLAAYNGYPLCFFGGKAAGTWS
jgi:hypothetical protein